MKHPDENDPHDQWNFEGGPIKSSAKGRFAIVVAALVILAVVVLPQVL